MLSPAVTAISTVAPTALSSNIPTSNTASKTLLITYAEWKLDFNPVQNALNRNATYDGHLFETYGSELAFVKNAPDDRIWTLLDSDSGDETVISPGWSRVNRMGYFVTAKPLESLNIVVIDSDEGTYLKRLKRHSGGVRGIEAAYELSAMMRKEFEACKLKWSKAKRPQKVVQSD